MSSPVCRAEPRMPRRISSICALWISTPKLRTSDYRGSFALSVCKSISHCWCSAVEYRICNLHVHYVIFVVSGPASLDVAMLEKMMETGMNVARLNFSHGSHEFHANTISNIRQAVKNYSAKIGMAYPLAIALDTKGPEIRTGLLEGVC